MRYKEIITSNIIGQILDSPFDKAFIIYSNNAELLKNISFILPHPRGLNYCKPFQDLKMDGINVEYFFDSETLVCFDNENVLAARDNQAESRIEAVISLDTQIQSYIYRQYIDKSYSIPKNLSEILKLIQKRRWAVECLPYTLENTLFNPSFLMSKIYKDNMLAVETYFGENRLKSRFYSSRLIEWHKKMLRTAYANSLRRQYKLIYLNLLVMTDITFHYKELSLYEKERKIIDYFHKKIGIIAEREICLAKIFFTYGTKMKFFGKIQKNKIDNIKNLKNIAWDIFHIHNTINNVNFQSDGNVNFTIPYFVTYDKRLKEILNAVYKIKSLAFEKGGTQRHIKYSTDILTPEIRMKYFSSEMFLERQHKINGLNELDLIEMIQSEIEKYERILCE